ncbi:hypothetical protein ACVBE9_10120 [Eionea flava]
MQQNTQHPPHSPFRQKALNGYLQKYAEPEHCIATHTCFKAQASYSHCLVIPAFNETRDFVTRINTFNGISGRLLLIIIINQPDNVIDQQKNQSLWDYFCQLDDDHKEQQPYSINNSSNTAFLFKSLSTNSDCLVIDRFTQAIPRKKGVGLARKIGGDIACQLIYQQTLQSHWIHYSDADTHWPSTYFDATATLPSHYSAAVYPYKHAPSGDTLLDNATQQYEASLHYYVDQLKQANSPYAYHTLGSCIATNAYHYSQVRGFPKRSGGEDFYLLNKLAKVGSIFSLEKPTLLIDSRLSQRVPFGTGPAVEKIIDTYRKNEQETTKARLSIKPMPRIDYHPQCFAELASLLQHFNHLYDYKSAQSNTEKPSYAQWLNVLSPALQQALHHIGVDVLFRHISKQTNSPQQCIQHCHYWLDGFKTLKLIHLLTETYPKTIVPSIGIENNTDDADLS